MPKRYYDYDTLREAMHDVVLGNGAKHKCIDAGMILDLPKADVVERKKGKWVRDEFGSKCTFCGLYAYRNRNGLPWESEFCPNCGADMRGEKTDE